MELIWFGSSSNFAWLSGIGALKKTGRIGNNFFCVQQLSVIGQIKGMLPAM